jgi:succinate dehydrogenase/fumarate reductase flavoprotein subunit
MHHNDQEFKSALVVIGGGGAGLSAALIAKDM